MYKKSLDYEQKSLAFNAEFNKIGDVSTEFAMREQANCCIKALMLRTIPARRVKLYTLSQELIK